MEIYLNRNGTGKDINDISTIGELTVNHIKILILEDDYDETKVYGHTRIPAGKYEIRLRTSGRLHDKYTNKYPFMHAGMLWLQDVPNYTWIYIHNGATAKHTLGCLLTGTNKVSDDQIKGTRESYCAIYSIISDKLLKKEKVFINIID